VRRTPGRRSAVIDRSPPAGRPPAGRPARLNPFSVRRRELWFPPFNEQRRYSDGISTTNAVFNNRRILVPCDRRGPSCCSGCPHGDTCRVLVRPHRSSTYVDAAYCYRPSSVICRSVTVVSPKTAERIEMAFVLWAGMGPRNRVRRESRSPVARGNCKEGEHARACPTTLCSELCKMAKPMEIPFELWTPVGRRKHMLHGGALAPPGEYN